jgi:hypothetical protein
MLLEFLCVQDDKHRDDSRCGSLKAAPRIDKLLYANVSQHLSRNARQISTQSGGVGSDMIVHVRNELDGTLHRILHHAAILGIHAEPNQGTTENENAFKYSGHDPLLLALLKTRMRGRYYSTALLLPLAGQRGSA